MSVGHTFTHRGVLTSVVSGHNDNSTQAMVHVHVDGSNFYGFKSDESVVGYY